MTGGGWRQRKARVLVTVALVAAVVLIPVLIAVVFDSSQPTAASRPLLTIGVVSSGGFPYELLVPSVVYPNETVAMTTGAEIEGNGSFQHAGTQFGPAFRILGSGALTIRIEYNFPANLVGNESRFPELYPDLSMWVAPGGSVQAGHLGNVSVYASGIPSGETLDLSMILDYGGQWVTHQLPERRMANGWTSVPAFAFVREG